MRIRSCHFVVAVLASTAMTFGQTAVHDLFERANGTNLGPDWVEQDSDATINGNQLQANANFSFGWSSHTVFSAPRADTVVQARWAINGGGGDSLSVVAGVDPSTWMGVEARIADNNGDSLADRLFFNAAVNAGNWYGGSLFYNLATPRGSGIITLSFQSQGQIARVEITDPNGANPEVFFAYGIPATAAYGTGVGMGYFGNGRIDDFRAWRGVPGGVVATANPPRTGAPCTLVTTGTFPSGLVALGFSLTGAGPLTTGIGDVLLSDPIQLFGIFPSDANGTVTLPLGAIPAGLTGVQIYHQSLDVVNPTLSNGFRTTIL